MKSVKPVLAILASTVWISLHEFARNQLLFPQFWTDHYQKLGIVFPADPVNGAMWGVWAMLFSGGILALTKKYTMLQSAALAWLFGFVLMWVVIGNLGVLPFGLLVYAVPWSMLEAFGAAYLLKKIDG